MTRPDGSLPTPPPRRLDDPFYALRRRDWPEELATDLADDSYVPLKLHREGYVHAYVPDARAWEVTRDGRHLAVFIGDYFSLAASWLFLCGPEFAAMDGGMSYAQVQDAVAESENIVSDPPVPLDLDLARRHMEAIQHGTISRADLVIDALLGLARVQAQVRGLYP